MLHGAGIFTNIYPTNDAHLSHKWPIFTNIYPIYQHLSRKYTSTMEHLGIDLGCLPAQRDLSTETGDRRVTITVWLAILGSYIQQPPGFFRFRASITSPNALEFDYTSTSFKW